MPKKKKIAIISSSLLTSGIIFLLLSMYIFGIFLLITGTVYLLLCAIVLFAQKHVQLCPSCGFEVLGARKEFNRIGSSKCPKCGALIFTHLDKLDVSNSVFKVIKK